MAETALALGPIAFKDFEVPSGISFGGLQRLVVHRLMNGQRIIDSLGPDEADIAFSGVFSGPSAMSRARTVDSLRIQGNPIPLVWDTLRYTAIVRIFEADYRSPYWIPYNIGCTVLQSPSIVSVTSSIAVADAVQSDINIAAGFQQAAGVSLSGVQTAVGQPNATTFGTSPYATLVATLSFSQSGIQQQIANTEAPLATLISSFGGASASTAVTAYLSTVAGTKQLAALAQTRSYLGCAMRNLAGQG